MALSTTVGHTRLYDRLPRQLQQRLQGWSRSANNNRRGKRKVLATMTIKYLHDLSALQVPQIDLAVFAPRHDPLAARDTEARGDAVL